MTVRTKNCEVVTQNTSVNFAIPCGGSYQAYESLFRNTRVTATFYIKVNSGTSCTFTATFDRAGQPSITVSIAPTDPNRSINLAVDHLEKVTFSCSGEAGGTGCQGYFYPTFKWCKCC